MRHFCFTGIVLYAIVFVVGTGLGCASKTTRYSGPDPGISSPLPLPLANEIDVRVWDDRRSENAVYGEALWLIPFWPFGVTVEESGSLPITERGGSPSYDIPATLAAHLVERGVAKSVTLGGAPYEDQRIVYRTSYKSPPNRGLAVRTILNQFASRRKVTAYGLSVVQIATAGLIGGLERGVDADFTFQLLDQGSGEVLVERDYQFKERGPFHALGGYYFVEAENDFDLMDRNVQFACEDFCTAVAETLASRGYAPSPMVATPVDTPRPPPVAADLPTTPQRWVALLIGIGDYRSSGSPFSDLQTPGSDLARLARLLSDDYGFEEVRILRDGEATRAGVLRAFEDLHHDTTRDDNVLVYYAGHGNLLPSGAGSWITAGAGSEFDGIGNAEIKTHLENLKARRVLLISDSCFSGDFINRAVGRPTSEAPLGASDDRWAAALKANALPARQVLSSGNLEPVPDSDNGYCAGHSPFACSLVLAMEQTPRGGAISASQIYTAVRAQLNPESRGGPEPQQGTLEGHRGGMFFMVRRAN